MEKLDQSMIARLEVWSMVSVLPAPTMVAWHIERQMGRVRQQRWGPRLIDLDLVWMAGGVIEEAGLTLPHPGVSMRNFVLYPLADIAPTLDIPGHGRVMDLKRRSGADGISVLE